MAVAADQGSWQVSQGVLDGQVIFTRFNTALVSVADRADYAFQIGVAVPLLDPAIAGLPQGPEFAQLDEIEGLIVQAAGARCLGRRHHNPIHEGVRALQPGISMDR